MNTTVISQLLTIFLLLAIGPGIIFYLAGKKLL